MAIEKEILANMHRAITEGDFQQAVRAIKALDDLKEARTQGFIDYLPESGVDFVSLKRLDDETFAEQLRSSSLGSGLGRSAIGRMYGRGSIGRLEDLAHLSDRTILRSDGVGKVVLRKIREVYPFVPRA